LGELTMSTASGLLGGRAYFLHWGVIQISLANFVVIALMVTLFVLALVVPFPQGRADAIDDAPGVAADDDQSSV
jgi:hypothetical protein